MNTYSPANTGDAVIAPFVLNSQIFSPVCVLREYTLPFTPVVIILWLKNVEDEENFVFRFFSQMIAPSFVNALKIPSLHPVKRVSL